MSTEEQVIDQTQTEEVVASPTDTEELDLELEEVTQPEQGTSADDVEALKAKVADLEKKNSQLYARVKKQEKPKAEPAVKVNSNPDYLTREEALLLKKDLSIEEVDFLKDLQAVEKLKGKTVKLDQLLEDERFLALKERKDKARKKEQAQLGASRGGSQTKSEVKPGMTEDEHRAVWNKLQK